MCFFKKLLFSQYYKLLGSGIWFILEILSSIPIQTFWNSLKSFFVILLFVIKWHAVIIECNKTIQNKNCIDYCEGNTNKVRLFSFYTLENRGKKKDYYLVCNLLFCDLFCTHLELLPAARQIPNMQVASSNRFP